MASVDTVGVLPELGSAVMTFSTGEGVGKGVGSGTTIAGGVTMIGGVGAGGVGP